MSFAASLVDQRDLNGNSDQIKYMVKVFTCGSKVIDEVVGKHHTPALSEEWESIKVDLKKSVEELKTCENDT